MVRVLSCSSSDFSQIGNAISNGSTVVYPTDTVFGLGSGAGSEAGLLRCFEMKGRERSKPMPVLFSRIVDVRRAVRFDAKARSLAKGFWPGALTLILPIEENSPISRKLVSPEGTLAVRIPDHDCCRSLISACGGALIGTSANISGQPTAVSSEDPKLVEFAKSADFFVKGDFGVKGVSSTIVELHSSGELKFIREGAISRNEVLSYLEKESNTDFSTSNSMI